MTKDEMMLAFRMIAMGRPSTPHVEALVDFLLGAPVAEPEPVVQEPATLDIELPEAPTAEIVQVEAKDEPAKRGPGRPKKAS